MDKEYTYDELSSKRVFELKELAQEYNLETEGLKKADLIEALLAMGGNQVEETEIANECVEEESTKCADTELLEDVEEELDSEEVSHTSEIESTAAVTEEAEEAEEVDETHVKYKMLSNPAILYQDKACTKPLAKIQGRVKFEGDLATIHISGRGILKGYLNI